ncbi:hypothetical protein MNBD_BACTEROID05-47 [hydrothermal vent metagenome]|uniref:Response regulatory domain-containing protein n=1 Tax=hydrothermal vent metagenome TaxID=652676 RepID=A0A3B0T8F6_9ZZZZ
MIPLTKDDLAGKKVVIVDSYKTGRELVEKFCSYVDMDIIHSSDQKEEVISYLSGINETKDFPDLIFVDPDLMEDSKPEIILNLTTNEKFKNTKVIAFTSEVRVGSAALAQDLGFDAFMPKPISRVEFMRVVATVLGDQRDQGEIVTRHFSKELACKGVRVLVVEDHPQNRKLMGTFLNGFGCETTFAENGQVAIDDLKDNEYDICFMDLQMPILGGIEATKVIRSQITVELPIIALTAAVMKEDREKCAAVGMNDFLMKPVSKKVVEETILKYVNPFE